MSFARLNATKLYRVEGAIVKVDMAKNHFSKSVKKKYIFINKIIIKCIYSLTCKN